VALLTLSHLLTSSHLFPTVLNPSRLSAASSHLLPPFLTSSQPLLTSSLLHVSTSILTELYLNSASHYSTLLYFTLFYSPLSSTLLYFTLLYSEYFFWTAMAPRQIVAHG
jgi:hypothetical protein